MALINCPNCGEKVSDAAGSCPYCSGMIPEMINCPECGKSYQTGEPRCPSCGCPNPVKKSSRKKRKIILTVILIAVLAAAAVFIIYEARKNKEDEYRDNIEITVKAMTKGCNEINREGGLIMDVWRNSILRIRDSETDRFTMSGEVFNEDFNTSLNNLFYDSEFIQRLDRIYGWEAEIGELMKKLKDPPKKYEDAYFLMKTFYDQYLQFSGMVTSPKGTLESYTENFEKLSLGLPLIIEKIFIYLD